MMNMVRMTAIRMIEEKKDGKNCWYDKVDEGEESVDDYASFTSILVVTVFSSTIGDFVTPKPLITIL